MVAISLVSLVVATIVGVTTGEELADDLSEERIRATAESAAFDVQAELRGLRRTTDGLAASLQAAASVDFFGQAFVELQTSIDERDYEDEFEELLTAYREDYLDPLRAAGRDVQLRDITPASPAAAYLQYEYAIDLGAVARPATLDDAGDESTWTEVHLRVHPVYRDVVSRLDLLDLYLVGTDGHVLYTVNKRPDLGTNLRTGPYSGSVVANTFRRVVNDPDAGAVTSDLRFYDAIPNEPVGTVGSPIFDGSQLVGALIVSYDGANITDLVTAEATWEAAGLPETADVYVIGEDGSTRSDPRLFLEDETEYLDAAVAAGRLEDDERARIESTGTTALTQFVVDETRDAGVSGDERVRQTASITDASVLSLSVPVASDAVDWIVVTEVDAQVAGRGLDDFQELLIVGAAIFVVLVAFVAVAWANGIIRPVRMISDRLGRHERSDEPVQLSPQTPVEIQQLAGRLDVMKRTLKAQHHEIARARDERLALLRSMLPPSVAQRLASGDVRSLEPAAAATVVVVVVLGLADLARGSAEPADRELIDHLLAELDGIAADHGLDRIKVVGDAYYAACGHDRPYIDHAPRAVGFAVDALDAIADLDTDVPLEFAIGVHSGPVTTGMAGGASLVYDVWGMTVSHAHVLARNARGGEIRISGNSELLLPESIVTESVEDADDTFRVTPANQEASTS